MASKAISKLFNSSDETLNHELLAASKMHHLPPEELFYKWESYTFNNPSDKLLSIGSLRNFKLQLQSEATQNTPAKKTGLNLKKRINQPNQSTPLRVLQSPNTPSSYTPTNDSTPKPTQSSQLTQYSFAARKNPGLVVNTVNGHLNVAPGNSAFDSRVELNSTMPIANFKYRYMFEKLSERSAVLDDRIDYFANRVKELYKGEANFDIGDPSTVNMSQRICIGRICKETDTTKLDDDSVILETSKSLGSGARVPIRFSDNCRVRGVPKGSGGIRLFPGRIIGVLGINRGAGYFGVEEVFTMPPLSPVRSPASKMLGQQHSPERLASAPMSVMVATGPYTLKDDLNFEPFDALMTQVEKRKPDVIVLLGPFIDMEHPLIKKGDIDLLPEDLFKMRIGNRLTRAFEVAKGCTAIIVPSVNDLITPHVAFPQFALPRNNMGLPAKERCKCISNPTSFYINEVLFGVSNIDNVMHMRGQEFFKNLIAADEEQDAQPVALKDNMGGLCRDIIDQQIYYPLFPPPKEYSSNLNLDVSHLELASFPTGLTGKEVAAKVIPDILIVPSVLKHFIKKVDQTICINPFMAAKGRNAGTFAHLSIHPMSKQDLMAQEGNFIQHNLSERCRVDIINI